MGTTPPALAPNPGLQKMPRSLIGWKPHGRPSYGDICSTIAVEATGAIPALLCAPPAWTPLRAMLA